MVRVGISGTGGFALEHVGAWRDESGVKLVGVYGGHPSRLAAFAQQTGIPACSTLRELLSRCDALDIVSRNDDHFEQGLAAIAAGRHVLIEKPVALNREDATILARSAGEAGVVHGTVHPMRYGASMRAFWDVVESGFVGAPRSCEVRGAWPRPQSYYEQNSGWRADPAKSGGGVLVQQFIHLLDLVLWRLGPIKAIDECDITRKDVSGVESAFVVKAVCASGVALSLHGSALENMPGEKRITITGDIGSVSVSGGIVRISRDGCGDEETSYVDAVSPLRALLGGFRKAVADGTLFMPSLEDGVRCLGAIEHIYSASGRTACRRD